jgi:hypothetical protein
MTEAIGTSPVFKRETAILNRVERVRMTAKGRRSMLRSLARRFYILILAA